MYDGYAFEVIVEKNGHYPRDHDYPAVPRRRCWGIVGTGSTCGCWKSCSRSTWCGKAIDRYSTAKGLWRAGQADREAA